MLQGRRDEMMMMIIISRYGEAILLIYTSSDASDMCEVMCDVSFDNDSRERS